MGIVGCHLYLDWPNLFYLLKYKITVYTNEIRWDGIIILFSIFSLQTGLSSDEMHKIINVKLTKMLLYNVHYRNQRFKCRLLFFQRNKKIGLVFVQLQVYNRIESDFVLHTIFYVHHEIQFHMQSKLTAWNLFILAFLRSRFLPTITNNQLQKLKVFIDLEEMLAMNCTYRLANALR